MPFFHSINTLYIHVPKAGGSSIEDYFYEKTKLERNESTIYGWYFDKPSRIRVPDDRSLQHFTYQEICKKKEYFNFKEDPSMKIIVSVRNPFERAVSDLFWTKKVNLESTKEDVERELICYLHKESNNIYDNHKLPQHKFVTDLYGNVLPNIHIVRTERLKEDMHRIGYTDFDIHTNKNRTGQSIDYYSLLTEKSIEVIRNYYSDDFTIFEYSRNPFQSVQLQKEPGATESYNTTIVTAFMSNINKNKNRSLETYIEYGKKLLAIPNPKIVFIDEYSHENFFKNHEEEYPLTCFVLFDKKSIYLYNYEDELTNFFLNTGNPEKDTLDYIFVQCNKTEWVESAINMNVWKTNQYVWIDFGIFHMIRDEDKFVSGINHVVNQTHNTLRIASCKYKEYVFAYNIYDTITWTFAGSVFGGDVDSLLKFAYLTKAEILRTIRERKHIMWEINMWYLVNKRCPELMEFYSCSHDIRILYHY